MIGASCVFDQPVTVKGDLSTWSIEGVGGTAVLAAVRDAACRAQIRYALPHCLPLPPPSVQVPAPPSTALLLHVGAAAQTPDPRHQPASEGSVVAQQLEPAPIAIRAPVTAALESLPPVPHVAAAPRLGPTTAVERAAASGRRFRSGSRMAIRSAGPFRSAPSFHTREPPCSRPAVPLPAPRRSDAAPLAGPAVRPPPANAGTTAGGAPSGVSHSAATCRPVGPGSSVAPSGMSASVRPPGVDALRAGDDELPGAVVRRVGGARVGRPRVPALVRGSAVECDAARLLRELNAHQASSWDALLAAWRARPAAASESDVGWAAVTHTDGTVLGVAKLCVTPQHHLLQYFVTAPRGQRAAWWALHTLLRDSELAGIVTVSAALCMHVNSSAQRQKDACISWGMAAAASSLVTEVHIYRGSLVRATRAIGKSLPLRPPSNLRLFMRVERGTCGALAAIGGGGGMGAERPVRCDDAADALAVRHFYGAAAEAGSSLGGRAETGRAVPLVAACGAGDVDLDDIYPEFGGAIPAHRNGNASGVERGASNAQPAGDDEPADYPVDAYSGDDAVSLGSAHDVAEQPAALWIPAAHRHHGQAPCTSSTCCA